MVRSLREIEPEYNGHDHIDKVFELLGKGLSAEEIGTRLAQEPKRPAEPESPPARIGGESPEQFKQRIEVQNKIIKVLSPLPDVQNIQWLDPNNANGADIDMLVQTNIGGQFHIKIRPNKEAVHKHRRDLHRRLGLGEVELDEWLKSERRIILNAGKTEELIQQSFMDQVEAIRHFHRT